MGLRMSPAWFCLSGMMGLRLAEGGLLRPPHVARMVLFVRDVTKKYQGAVREHGFKNMMGDNASAQPGHMQEVLLHETAVSWIRLRLAATVPSKPWLETRGEYASRLRRVVDDININLDVEGLCKGLLKRSDLAIEAKGGRIPK